MSEQDKRVSYQVNRLMDQYEPRLSRTEEISVDIEQGNYDTEATALVNGFHEVLPDINLSMDEARKILIHMTMHDIRVRHDEFLGQNPDSDASVD